MRDNSEGTGWSTLGIDMFVTSSRMILLDTQPVLNSANLERGVQLEKKFPGEVNPGESSSELASLQMAALLLSVCHVVLIVEDCITDSELIRSVNT